MTNGVMERSVAAFSRTDYAPPGASEEAPLVLWVLAYDGLIRRGVLSALEDDQDTAPRQWQLRALRPDELLSSNDPEQEWPDLMLWDAESLLTSESRSESRQWGVPVLALCADATTAQECLAAGAVGVLFREAQGQQILAAAQAALTSLTVIDPIFMDALLQPLSTSSPHELIEPLTPREQEVLLLLAEGFSNKEIGQALSISEHTAKFHVNAIRGKLDAQSRTEAVVKAARWGLLHL